MEAGVWGSSNEGFGESGRFWSMCAEQGMDRPINASQGLGAKHTCCECQSLEQKLTLRLL